MDLGKVPTILSKRDSLWVTNNMVFAGYLLSFCDCGILKNNGRPRRPLGSSYGITLGVESLTSFPRGKHFPCCTIQCCRNSTLRVTSLRQVSRVGVPLGSRPCAFFVLVLGFSSLLLKEFSEGVWLLDESCGCSYWSTKLMGGPVDLQQRGHTESETAMWWKHGRQQGEEAHS